MATTVTGTGITFSGGSVQDTGTYTGLDTQNQANSSTVYSAFAIGTYLLIENQAQGSFSVAVPLNGWDSSTYSGPNYRSSQNYAAYGGFTVTNSVSNSITLTQGSTTPICFQRLSSAVGTVTASGTWKNRGGNLIGFLVQRVA